MQGWIMYAVVRTGGKQYRVTAGQILEVEALSGQPGDPVELTDVLLLADGDKIIVEPRLLEGACVQAQITGQRKGRKIEVFRYRPKKRVRVRRGHRQRRTRLQIESIAPARASLEPASEADGEVTQATGSTL